MAKFKGTRDRDIYAGTSEADFIQGGGGDDSLRGQGGNDRIFGGAGADYLEGGEGDDLLDGGSGNDTLYGDLYGAFGDDVVSGGDGDDIIYGGGGDDDLDGGDGDDTFDVTFGGGAGTDVFRGGDGFDVIRLFDRAATNGAIVDLRSQTISDDGYGNRETLTSIEGVSSGTVFADKLYGNDGDNLLFADQGDKVFGYGGNDSFLVGSVKATAINGGDGADFLVMTGIGGSHGDTRAKYGVDIDLSKQLIIDDGFGNSGHVKSIEGIFGGAYSDVIRGSRGDDVLGGDYGDDKIYGGAGNDLIFGGSANRGDQLYGGSGTDTFAFLNEDYIFGSGPRYINDFTTKERGAADGRGDKIDVSALTTADFHDVTFNFIGQNAFDENDSTGQIRFDFSDDNSTTVQIKVFDSTGGGEYDTLSIILAGHIDLTATDFVL